MMTSNPKWLASIAIAVGITLSNMWMLNHLVDHGHYGLLLAQAWSGMVILLGLGYAAGVVPALSQIALAIPADRPAWLKAAAWTFICCGIPWISLPGGGSLGLPAAILFFVLIWRAQNMGPSRSFWQSAMLAGIFGFTLVMTIFIVQSPFRLARLMADFSGPLDLEGRHYFHGIVLRAIFGVRMLGEASSALPLHFERLNTPILLRLAHSSGALPAALLAAALLLGWRQLHTWLQRVIPGAHLTTGMQNLGLALVTLHGIATLFNVLWSFGLTRQPFGPGLPPLTTNAAWWVLSACLIWVLVLAWRQKVQTTDEIAHQQRPFWSTASLATGFVGVMSFGLLIAVDAAKDVYADNRIPESAQLARRDITDRHGKVIATSVPAYDLWLKPNRFWGISPANPGTDMIKTDVSTPDEQRRQQLLDYLGDFPQLRRIADSRMSNYGKSDEGQKILAWGIQPAVATKISAGHIEGLKLTPRPIRQYPQGSLYAHALGFTSLADPQHGQEGLELVANTELLRPTNNGEGNAGKPLQTTLDPDIQNAAAQALQEGITKHGAIGGAAVVIEANTGKIRAMVSSPDFDANDNTTYRNPYQPERILNRARGINFPVGSLLTPLLAAHMIETGRMKPSTLVSIGNKLTIGKQTIVDVSPAGTLSLAEIVTKSSAIGQAKLALTLPISELRDVARHLGIGEPLYIGGLMGCIDYQAIQWSNWTPQMKAQPGMHINTNLLQAMRAYLPLANGGRLGRISLIETPTTPPRAFARVLSDNTVKAMRDILSAAAGPTGTAPLAQLSDVMVAGKTGTTIASNGHTVSVFIGMTPADRQPRYLIGVLLEFPDRQIKLAGNTAAPVFARLLEKIIESEKAQATPEPDRQFALLAPTEPANT